MNPKDPTIPNGGDTPETRPGAQPSDSHERIGPYRIRQTLGEGGFGVVYEAQQTEPVKRSVALKVIKPGMDSAAVLARFEAERQALAVMDHPCIAKVLDAGMTDQGRPYFAMELVRGEPITEFCDRNRIALRDRLKLFIRVCDAVQHAHTKGVIHRDLKPSNILVAYRGDEIEPKVIDFGVAKALNQKLSEHTVFTAQGQLIGTPEYMSPEQAEMGATDIDTRSDVYSLGVVLYELLTGARPFESETLRRAGIAEIQRIIRETEPPKPSTRLASIASHADDPESVTRIAKARRTEIRSLSSTLKRDLDWVVMTCLEKDRARRYDTASELEAEIGRYLRDEPVLAGPPAVGYRVRKFVKRNQAAVVGFIGFAVVMLGLSMAAGWAASRVHRVELEREVYRSFVTDELRNLGSTQRIDQLEKFFELTWSLFGESEETALVLMEYIPSLSDRRSPEHEQWNGKGARVAETHLLKLDHFTPFFDEAKDVGWTLNWTKEDVRVLLWCIYAQTSREESARTIAEDERLLNAIRARVTGVFDGYKTDPTQWPVESLPQALIVEFDLHQSEVASP